MFFSSIGKKILPSFVNVLWAIISSVLLVFAFPDYEIWYLAYVALIPLFYAIEQEKASLARTFVIGWIWGICFFFGSCWWISFPMKTYAGIPSVIAYAMALCVTIIAGLFPAIFALILAKSLKTFGVWAILFAPFIWVFAEFLRFWLTGNNWNAIGYSQMLNPTVLPFASVGGVLLASFVVLTVNSCNVIWVIGFFSKIPKNKQKDLAYFPIISLLLIILSSWISWPSPYNESEHLEKMQSELNVIAIQANVPMSGLNFEQWKTLRNRHVELAENEINRLRIQDSGLKTKVVIFPESPMNFEYAKDSEFREFIKNFATRNNVSVLFNAGEPVYPQYVNREPDTLTQEQIIKSLETYNSAVLVDEKGELAAQYDKIHLLPFGEFIPLPTFLAQYVPPVVGNFTYGKEFDILKLGDLKSGVMICFESHFPSLSREYVNRDADVLIEITNDGYLGNTPILRQHLANAVFRAVETNRPVVRVTNVGITAYIDEKGNISEPTEGFTEATRVWTISKSNGEKTFYVKYGDWFAWLSCLITLLLLLFGLKKRHET
jgi:apolipoprotein N-acyltransferase